MAFVAAMQARTPSIRDHHLRFWKQVQEIGEEIEAKMKDASPEQQAAAATSIPAGGPVMTIDDVRSVTASPMEHLLVPLIQGQLPLLMAMRCRVLCTDDQTGFITSDAPVVWFDPEWHKKPPLYQSPSFTDPKLEISLPLSPSQMLIIDHQDEQEKRTDIEYLAVRENVVEELNRRTRFHCDKEFVVRRNITHSRWFEQGK